MTVIIYFAILSSVVAKVKNHGKIKAEQIFRRDEEMLIQTIVYFLCIVFISF